MALIKVKRFKPFITPCNDGVNVFLKISGIAIVTDGIVDDAAICKNSRYGFCVKWQVIDVDRK